MSKTKYVAMSDKPVTLTDIECRAAKVVNVFENLVLLAQYTMMLQMSKIILEIQDTSI